MLSLLLSEHDVTGSGFSLLKIYLIDTGPITLDSAITNLVALAVVSAWNVWHSIISLTVPHGED